VREREEEKKRIKKGGAGWCASGKGKHAHFWALWWSQAAQGAGLLKKIDQKSKAV